MRRLPSAALAMFNAVALASLAPQVLPNKFIQQLLCIGVGALVAYGIMRSGGSTHLPLSRAAIGVYGFFASACASLLVHAVLMVAVEPTFNRLYLNPTLLFYAAVISICAATFGEFLFRGPLLAIQQRKQRPPTGIGALICAQAVIFTALHYNPHRLPVFYIAVFAMGMLTGLLAAHSGALWAGIGVHAGVNFTSAIVNGIHMRRWIDMPGVLSFESAGNTAKIAASVIVPIAGLCWLAWRIHRHHHTHASHLQAARAYPSNAS